jgi:diaminopimelate decarboxylase
VTSPEAPRRHAPHPYFQPGEGPLCVDGVSLAALAARVGSTPFYLYVRRHMSERVGELRRLLPADLHLHYAVKANPMPAVVQHMSSLVDGLDVASGRELAIALDSGMAPDRISFAGPGKTPAELECAVAAGIVINVESELEIQRVAEIAVRRRCRPAIAVRVNPDFELKSSGMRMSGGPKPFGIDAERVPDALSIVGGLPLDFVGFHIFSGSQNLRADAIVDAQRKSLALAIELASSAPAPVRILNIGGGFGIPYFPGEPPLDLMPIAVGMKALADLCANKLPDARLILELGRYLVGESGLYICKVIDRKVSRGRVFLITDGGLHHHLAASGNFGQVIRKNFPVVIATRAHDTPMEVASVVGPLCTPLDLLADQVDLPQAQPGDLVAVLQSGAYGLSASPLGFLSHPHPQEVLL